MKTDRRWWNDGRLEREGRAWTDRDLASDEVHAYYRNLYGFEVEVRETPGGYHVTAQPSRKQLLRITLPREWLIP